MTPLTALWLPIVLSAVIVFVASSIIHMFLGWHASDYTALPDEKGFAEAVRPLAIPPGDYMVPRPSSMAEMKSPELVEKRRKGPVMVLTVLPTGETGMGANLAQWFVFSLVVGVFAAYVTGRALAPGAHYLQVFRFAGTTTFIAHACGLWPMSIWYRRRWSTTIKSTIDSLIYGLLAAGVFGWLWPR